MFNQMDFKWQIVCFNLIALYYIKMNFEFQKNLLLKIII